MDLPIILLIGVSLGWFIFLTISIMNVRDIIHEQGMYIGRLTGSLADQSKRVDMEIIKINEDIVRLGNALYRLQKEKKSEASHD